MFLADVLEQRFFTGNFTTIRDEKTRRHYRRAVKWLGLAIGEPPKLQHLNDDNVRRVMQYCERERGQKPPTVNTTRKCLMALARWCRDEGLVDRVPRVGKLIEPYNPPEALTASQLASLWNAATTCPGEIAGAPARVWWPCVIWIEADTAVRMSELLSLEWNWIEPESGIVRVPWNVRKGKRRGEVYRLSESSLRWLAQLRPHTLPSGLVFGRISLATYYAKWDAMQCRAGIPEGRRWKTQCLRRTIATLSVVAGADPSRVLRQSSPSVAWQSYVDPTPTAVPATTRIGDLLPFGVCQSSASTASGGMDASGSPLRFMNAANASKSWT